MNLNRSLGDIKKELNSLKTAFSLVGENIIIFEYKIVIDESNQSKHYLTIETDDGTDTIAYVTNATRWPSLGPNTWYLSFYKSIGDVIVVRTLRKGRIILHD